MNLKNKKLHISFAYITTIILITIYTNIVYASTLQNAKKKTAQTQSLPQNQEEQKISHHFFRLDLSYNTNMYETADPDYSSSSDLMLTYRYKFSSNYTYLLVFGANQDFVDDKKTTLYDTTTALSTTLYDNTGLSISGKIALTIPTDRESRDNTSLITQIATGVGFVYSVPALKELSFSYSPTYTLNIHEYQTQLSGVSNNQHSFKNTFSASLDLFESLNFDITYIHRSNWTYEGYRKTDAFQLDETLTYTISPSISLAAGHSNYASIYKANGADSNYKFYDRDSSTYSLSLTVNL